MIVRKVGPLSCAKIAGVIYAILGLVFGALFSLISATGLAVRGLAGTPMGVVFGTAAVIVLPIFYGCIGFLVTLLGAWLYNLVAGFVGGIEIEVE